MKCLHCSAESELKRLPRGWHRDSAGNSICKDCWTQRYALRAVVFPVVGPVGREWAELREALRAAWVDCTALSNWLMTEMYTRDVRREPGTEKLPKWQMPYLYPEARERFPDLPSCTVSAITHTVALKYRAMRYKLIWVNEVSLPNYRYPVPFPVHNQGWRAKLGNGQVPWIEFRLAGQRWTLRLRGGPHYRRQMAAFRQIVDGAARGGELAVYRRRASWPDHRGGIAGRDTGGQRQPYRVMAKLVVWLPRQPTPKGAGTLWVRTDGDSFLIASNANDERLWVLNADHVRRWESEHQRRLSRWSDDHRAEQRRVASLQSRREASVAKYRRRIDSFCQEASAQLADYTARQRFSAVRYNDDNQSFCSNFPWHRLRTLVEQKLDAKGIEFDYVRVLVPGTSQELPASSEVEIQ